MNLKHSSQLYFPFIIIINYLGAVKYNQQNAIRLRIYGIHNHKKKDKYNIFSALIVLFYNVHIVTNAFGWMQ